MPGRIFTPQERKRLDAFPSEIGEADLIRYFTLSGSDLDLVRQQRGDHNRLGFALQLCALRYMGFSPDGLEIVPTMAVAFVAEQLHASPAALRDYGARSQETCIRMPLLTATFLTGRTPADLRPFLRFWNRISYPVWTNLEEAIRTGQAQATGTWPEETQRIVSEGIAAIQAAPSQALPSAYDFGRHRRILDLGGGHWFVAESHPAPV